LGSSYLFGFLAGRRFIQYGGDETLASLLLAYTAGEAFMDFFERVFGISPDGGNGSLEMIYLLIASLILFAVGRWYAHRAETPGPRQ
jgi:hypothetical protein